MNSAGETMIGRQALEIGDSRTGGFQEEDRLSLMTAANVGLTRGRSHGIRLLARGPMFEIYKDDILVQTFNTSREFGKPGKTPTALRFLARNGCIKVTEIQAWKMNV